MYLKSVYVPASRIDFHKDVKKKKEIAVKMEKRMKEKEVEGNMKNYWQLDTRCDRCPHKLKLTYSIDAWRPKNLFSLSLCSYINDLKSKTLRQKWNPKFSKLNKILTTNLNIFFFYNKIVSILKILRFYIVRNFLENGSSQSCRIFQDRHRRSS